MPGKRKRNRPGHLSENAPKRQRVSGCLNSRKDPVVKHALLGQYYANVLTLRKYLLEKLPDSSKIRRKKILSVGRRGVHKQETEAGLEEIALASFLDQTLVGVRTYGEVSPDERLKQWANFSQRADITTSTFGNTSTSGGFCQSEIVDFAIWLLFSKAQAFNGRVRHLLCQGFRKDATNRSMHRDENLTSAIPGVLSTHPNTHVTALKASPWPQILMLMGKAGEKTMIDLILDYGIFVAVQSGHGSYYQLSGYPLGDLQMIEQNAQKVSGPKQSRAKSNSSKPLHTPGSIVFVRNRMLYARAAFNAQGGVRFGLRHIHVLNRYPHKESNSSEKPLSQVDQASKQHHQNTVNVMMYIFPRQFGLHNIFTSEVDSRETVQRFKDYTLREDEISRKYRDEKVKIPKRLRVETIALVQKLQILHSRCAYNKLLEHYCPALNNAGRFRAQKSESQQSSSCNSTTLKTQTSIKSTLSSRLISSGNAHVPQRKPSLMDHATPVAEVSAYCRAVLLNLIPHGFWGAGAIQTHNEQIFYQHVHRFIELRRFESLSLHQVLQGMKVMDLSWLTPPGSTHTKTSQSDINKRLEIFHEFVYYLFDSILIPLIRANFYVTESNIHRYRLFYFRHDVWRSLAEPALVSLKLKMFEEVKADKAQKILDHRTLGFSQVRLLPKETGVRPIMNLRRRPMKKNNVLGISINSILAPAYNVLALEKNLYPDRLGSTLFSVGDMYQRLKTFKSKLNGSKPLYFVKVDVQSAFDTIPQRAMVALLSSLPSEAEYRISKHVEIKPSDGYHQDVNGKAKSKPMHKWVSLAKTPYDFESFDEALESNLGVGKNNTIFVENIVNQYKDKNELISLMAEHIHRNLVKIGKKFYRQKEGIPQGSVLSSFLCNYFYADLEANHLSFLELGDSLLLRLIDDFLLITTDRSKAQQFLQIMHDGLPAYGVGVNPEKTLTNFEATINNKKLKRLLGPNRNFPYCGNFIDTTTLNITKDRDRRKDVALSDSLTIEFSKIPGRNFQRKVLSAFKIQAHAMFLDTAFNSLSTVLSNLFSAFMETAMKMWTYARCISVNERLVINTINNLVELAFVLCKSKGRNKRNIGYRCAVKKCQVEWLCLLAMRQVLGRRQTGYRAVIRWLDQKIERLSEKEVIALVRTRMKAVLATKTTQW